MRCMVSDGALSVNLIQSVGIAIEIFYNHFPVSPLIPVRRYC